jgi:ribosomal protein S18 acetylase RimI-like enzyme
MLGAFRKTWADARTFGVAKGLHGLTYRVLNRLVAYQVLKAMKITRIDPAFLSGPPRYGYGFLDAAALRKFAADPQHDLRHDFLDGALAKGDECYAVLDGDKLANYGWYSNEPTAVCPGLVLHFSKDYMYMYKGYTHPDYRGRRLHAVAMTRALEAYLGRGYKGLVSYVESNNYSSLKSCYRMGYEDVGKVYVARLLGRYRTWHTGGCRAYDLRVLRTEPTGQATAPAKAG